jgi:hypothetical protein
MEHHDVILECAKFASLDTLERPREEVSHQGLPPTLRKRYSLEYSSLGNFRLCILQCKGSHSFCRHRLACMLSPGFTILAECVFVRNGCEKQCGGVLMIQIQHFKPKFLAFFIRSFPKFCLKCAFVYFLLSWGCAACIFSGTPEL